MQSIYSERNGKLAIRSIRDFIVDNGLTENDTIVVNTINFDDLVLEYRQTYNESVPIPFYFLTILIDESSIRHQVIPNRIKVIKNDPQRFFQDYLPFPKREIRFNDLNYADKIIYRCGWCGNVVDANGSEFTADMRNYKIKILETYREHVTQKSIDGNCCPNGPNG